MAFKFISDADTARTTSDATALGDNDLDFGAVTALGYRIVKFKVGRTNSLYTASYTVSATGTASANGRTLASMVFFTTDKFGGKGETITYTDLLTQDTSVSFRLGPNRISPTIWAVFACHPDFEVGEADIILSISETA